MAAVTLPRKLPQGAGVEAGSGVYRTCGASAVLPRVIAEVQCLGKVLPINAHASACSAVNKSGLFPPIHAGFPDIVTRTIGLSDLPRKSVVRPLIRLSGEWIDQLWRVVLI